MTTTANAQEQVERMLALVPYLRSRDGIPVDDVARDFGVPPAQIIKDLKVLWFCGLPDAVTGDMIDIDMEALDGEGVVKLSNADYLTRPLRLAPHEALALMVALRALQEVSGPGQRDAVDRALAKLEAATGEVRPHRSRRRRPRRPGRRRDPWHPRSGAGRQREAPAGVLRAGPRRDDRP